MKDVLIAAMQQDRQGAERLSNEMNVAAAPIKLQRFPDRESKVRVMQAGRVTVLYASLDRPDEKLIPLIFAASALRDLGAEKIILAAPYLCYMRQDKAFHDGEAVSQQVLAKILSPWIDEIVTVEPHLHRVADFSAVFPDIKAIALSAAPLLAALVDNSKGSKNILLVGPDQEARAWTKAVAEAAQAPFVIMTKQRRGDRDVEVVYDDATTVEGREVYLVDDIVSSGATLAAATLVLKQKGAARIEALAVHALCSSDDLIQLKEAGLFRLRSTDTVPHETNAISAAPLLADALRKEIARLQSTYQA